MSIEDIAIKGANTFRNGLFNIACTNIIGRIARDHNNVKSFNNKYTIVRTESGNLYIPCWYIECDDNMGIILGGYAKDDKCIAGVKRDGKERINITYQFAKPITHETEISDMCDELYDLILVLLHYDVVKEFNVIHVLDDHCLRAELTKQDLKNVLHENGLEDLKNVLHEWSR